MLRFPIKGKARKMKIPRQPNGPAEREKRLQKIVTTFIRHERIEGHHEYLDETRQYAEQLINLAILHGDKHKPTMKMADHWLLEKDLVHKLFKVLAPRYSKYTSSFSRIYKLPQTYPGLGMDRSILELKENPYPPVIHTHRNNERLLSNVLLNAVREEYQKGNVRVSENYTVEKHLDDIDQIHEAGHETQDTLLEMQAEGSLDAISSEKETKDRTNT